MKVDHHLRVIGVEDVWAMGDCATVAQDRLIHKFVDLFKEADKVSFRKIPRNFKDNLFQ